MLIELPKFAILTIHSVDMQLGAGVRQYIKPKLSVEPSPVVLVIYQ